ncbi:T9SS type A sorting domain-containing protein [Saccharicrinis sp. FJH2]|uniref:T9SS type A sorting domain-containing protein n=1 Tax=Saccharicrinis sp. FJH65 TaxID=3344659 RepID=UPI0035F2F93B
MKLIPYIVLAWLSIQITIAQQASFYGVEGWANATQGGQGGEIIRVTNLNSSGPGSFREAVLASFPRIVVFEVGGVIDLNAQNISIKNPFLTIAGQTAPYPGITIINGQTNIATHDVILQHIRIRPGAAGKNTGWEPDGLSTVSGSFVIIDHCSFSWAVDENCSASGPRFEGDTPDDWRNNTSHDVTISNCIIAEALAYATHTKGLHSMGSLIHDNATNIAILKNLYAHNNSRNPLFKGGARGVILNNMIYDPGKEAIHYALNAAEWEGYEWQSGEMSIIGNYMQLGISSLNTPFMKVHAGPCKIYMNNNKALNINGGNATFYTGDAANIVTEIPVWNDNIAVLSVDDVEANVIHNAGATPWMRDSVDIRIINDLINREGKIINYETEVGGYPQYQQTVQPFNADEWNLDFMIRKDPLLNLTVETPEPYHVAQPVNFNLDTSGFMRAIDHIDLLINGQVVQSKNENLTDWNYTLTSTETQNVVLIITCSSTEKLSTETFNLTIQNTTALNNPDQNKQPLQFHYDKNDQTLILSFNQPVNQNYLIKILDLNGRLVKQYESVFENITSFSCNLNDLPTGTYVLSLHSTESYFRKIFTKD